MPKDAVNDVASLIRTRSDAAHASASLSAGAASGPDIVDQIRRLGELRDAGVVTAEEFDRKKAELLERL